jgi:hypothetical protein
MNFPWMDMRVYIATGFDNGPVAAQLSLHLEDRGIGTTVKWWELPLHMETDPETRSLIALNDLQGVRRADLVVCLMKGDPATFMSSQLGTHGELGAACALGVPCLLVSPTRVPGPFCVFHRHPNVVARLVRVVDGNLADIIAARIPDQHGALWQWQRGPFEWEGDV